MNEGIHLDLDTWIVPGQIRTANLCRGLGNRYTPATHPSIPYKKMFTVYEAQYEPVHPYWTQIRMRGTAVSGTGGS